MEEQTVKITLDEIKKIFKSWSNLEELGNSPLCNLISVKMQASYSKGLWGKALKEVIEDAIEKLDPEYREILQVVYIEKKGNHISAGIKLNIKRATVYKNLEQPYYQLVSKLKELEQDKKRLILEYLPPVKTKNLIGREIQFAEIKEMLMPGSTVLICGPGGIGKTTLAAAIAHDLAAATSRFIPQGIFHHDFSSDPDTNSVIKNIIAFFSNQAEDTSQNTNNEKVKRALDGRQALFVLDSAEEAIDLYKLLNIPIIKNQCAILITSRKTSILSDTSIKNSYPPIELNTLSKEDSIKLLQTLAGDRATNKRVCEEICQFVDGVPLAIHLIGSAMRDFKQRDIDYLNILKETPLAILNQDARKEQSISITIGENLKHLTPRAFELLRTIGVLAPVSIGEAILRGIHPPQKNKLSEFINTNLTHRDKLVIESPPKNKFEELEELVNYGLLNRILPDKSYGPFEYDDPYKVYHKLIHIYVTQELVTCESVRKVADYYVQVVSKWKHKDLHKERLHIVHLINVCLFMKEWNLIIELVTVFDDFFVDRGYRKDCLKIEEIALQAAYELEDQDLQLRLLIGLIPIYIDMKFLEKAVECCQKAENLNTIIGNKQLEGDLFCNCGLCYKSLGNTKRAIKYYRKAINVSRQNDDLYKLALYFNNLGDVYCMDEKLKEAIIYYKKALKFEKQYGDKTLRCIILNSLGLLNRKLNQHSIALKYYLRSLTLSIKLGDVRGQLSDLCELGDTYLEQRIFQEAINFFNQALDIANKTDDLQNLRLIMRKLGKIYSNKEEKEIEKAAEYFRSALSISVEFDNLPDFTVDLMDLVDSYDFLGELEKAKHICNEAAKHAHRLNEPSYEATYLVKLASIYYKHRFEILCIENLKKAHAIWKSYQLEIPDRFQQIFKAYNIC